LIGGQQTLESYNWKIPAEHLAWADALPLLHVDKHRIYVHAAVDAAAPLEQQIPRNLLWSRYPRGTDYTFPGYHIVHGHTPNALGPERYTGRTNLDTKAFETGRLVIAVFNDETPGAPSVFLEVLAQP
jgi:serine/threonine protein phosphatase 1